MARTRVRKPGPGGNLDYVPHGSDQHAGLLGLKKAGKDDAPQLDEWAHADITMWGVTATEKFLMEKLRQKVSELHSESPKVQSEDPMAPHFAPAIWKPT